MGLLDGDGASILNSVFAAIYPSGILVRRTITEDEGGSQTATDTLVPIRVQNDRVTEAMRQSAGYTDTDVRLIILNTVGPITSDDIVVDHRGDAWSLIDPSLDTCGSHYEARGQRTSYVLPVDGDYLLSPVTGEILASPVDGYMFLVSDVILTSPVDGATLTSPVDGFILLEAA